MTSLIPILNIYHLLCYAWDVLEESEQADVADFEISTSADLLAAILIRGTNYQIRRGMDRAYIEETETASLIKGRLDMPSSLGILHMGRAKCSFDDFSYNILPNRILKKTLINLWLTDDLSRHLKVEIRSLIRQLNEVEPVDLNLDLFSKVKYHRNNRFYRLLMSVCELIFRELKPQEKSGNHRLPDFLREKKKLAKLFEKFVFRFYQRHASDVLEPGCRVSRSAFRWPLQGTNGSDPSLIPRMETDVVLDTPAERIILDTKFYENALVPGKNGGVKLRSGHLYQLDAYMRYYRKPGTKMTGVLLYPQVGGTGFRKDYIKKSGDRYRFCTVNLGADWQDLEDELLSILIIEK